MIQDAGAAKVGPGVPGIRSVPGWIPAKIEPLPLSLFVCNLIARHMRIRMPRALKVHATDHVRTFEKHAEIIAREDSERKRLITESHGLLRRVAMRNRKLLATLAGIIVPATCGVIPVACMSQPSPPLASIAPDPSKITAENYKRIVMGMSRPQVEAILGTPGDIRTGPTNSRVKLKRVIPWMGTLAVSRDDKWITDTLEILVFYGQNNDVVLARAFELKKEE